MSFQREVVASMLIHEVVKVADVESVEFDCLVDSSVDCFSVILRKAVHQQVIFVHHASIGIRVVIVKSELLDSCKAIETPEFVIVSCVDNPIEGLLVIVDLSLFASKHSLQRVHHCQISVPLVGPFMADHVAFLHLGLSIRIRALHKVQEKIKPILYELTVFVSSQEVTFIGQMPSNFGVGLLIDCPIQRSSLDRMELHQHFRHFSESVVKQLAWLFTDVCDPTEIFQKEVGRVQVDASVGGDETQSVQVRFGLGTDGHVRSTNCIFDLVQCFCGQVFVGVIVVDFFDVVAGGLGVLDEVEDAELVRGGGCLRSAVPIQPQSLRQILPRFARRGGPPFSVGLDEGVGFVAEKVALEEGTFDDFVLAAVPGVLDAAVELAVRVGVGEVAERSDGLLELVLRHLGGVVEEVVVVAEAVVEVEPHLVGEEEGVHREQTVLVHREPSEAALELLPALVQLALPPLHHDLRGQGVGHVEVVAVQLSRLHAVLVHDLPDFRGVLHEVRVLRQQIADVVAVRHPRQEVLLRPRENYHVLVNINLCLFIFLLSFWAIGQRQKGKILRLGIRIARINEYVGLNIFEPVQLFREDIVLLDDDSTQFLHEVQHNQMLPHSFELTIQLQELASLSFQPFDCRIEIVFAGRREPVSIVVLRNDSDIEAALPSIPLDVLNIPLSDVVFSLGRVIQVQPHELWNSKLELLAGFGLLLALEIRAAGRTVDWAFRFVLQEFLGQNIDLFLVSFNKVVRTSEFIAGSLKSFDLLIQSFMYFQIIDFLLLELAGLLLEVAQLKADIAVSQQEAQGNDSSNNNGDNHFSLEVLGCISTFEPLLLVGLDVALRPVAVEDDLILVVSADVFGWRRLLIVVKNSPHRIITITSGFINLRITFFLSTNFKGRRICNCLIQAYFFIFFISQSYILKMPFETAD